MGFRFVQSTELIQRDVRVPSRRGEGIVLWRLRGRGRRGVPVGGCLRARGPRRDTFVRSASPYIHDRTTDVRARCRITALKISRKRDRLFGNDRAPCFEPVIDSAE